MKNLKKSTIVKIIVVLLVVGIMLFIPQVRQLISEATSSFKDIDSIKEYILSFGIWAPIVSFLLMIFQAVAAPLPAFLITFSNAALFGWIKGALLSWSSAMAGAVLCFYIAKFLGRDVVERLTSKFALKSVDDFFERYGNYAVLIARLLPFISFDIVSYAAGLTSMSFWSFFWATGVGQLPATLIYSYVGEMLVGGTQKFVIGLLVLFSLSALLVLIKKIVDDKKKNKVTSEIRRDDKLKNSNISTDRIK